MGSGRVLGGTEGGEEGEVRSRESGGTRRRREGQRGLCPGTSDSRAELKLKEETEMSPV
jgi:hypothetical protein